MPVAPISKIPAAATVNGPAPEVALLAVKPLSAKVPAVTLRAVAQVILLFNVAVPDVLFIVRVPRVVVAVVPPIDCAPVPVKFKVLVVPKVYVPLLVRLPERFSVPVVNEIVPLLIRLPRRLIVRPAQA